MATEGGKKKKQIVLEQAEIQSQVKWGFEQCGQMEGALAHGRGLALDESQGPFQPSPFSDSMTVLNEAKNVSPGSLVLIGSVWDHCVNEEYLWYNNECKYCSPC